MTTTPDTSIRNSSTRIDTGRSVIAFSTANLLDNQIMQAVKKCIESNHVNDVKFLQHLESIANNETKL